jgi:hypothetical protein
MLLTGLATSFVQLFPQKCATYQQLAHNAVQSVKGQVVGSPAIPGILF